MTKETTSFVYVTYILSTPEKVFEAITKPDVNAGAIMHRLARAKIHQ